MDFAPSEPTLNADHPPDVVLVPTAGRSTATGASPPAVLPYASATRRPRMLRAFAHANYRLFFGGQLVSLCGTFLSSVAVIWLVYHLTGDPWWLGVVGFAGQLPLFLVTPFAGVWVDRVDRRRLLVATQALSMLQSVALGVLVLAGVADQPHVGVPLIAALAAFQGLINAFDLPARQAFLVEMVTDRADVPNAIALNSTMVHTARLAGPALAGFLLYWVGPGWCFLIDGASYLAVIGSLLLMKVTPRPRPAASRGVLDELGEGLAYAWNHRPIRALLLLMAVISLAGMPAFSTLVPVFAHHFGRDGNDAKYLGFLMAASGLGALVGSLQLANRSSVAGLGRVIGVAALVFGASLVAFGFSRSLWVSLLIVPFAGYGMLMTFASSNTLLQTLADEDKRGRVMSLFTVAFIGMTPFGNLLAGGLAAAFARGAAASSAAAPGHDANLAGASTTIWVCGAICLAAAAVFAWRLPSLRRHARAVYPDRLPVRA